MTSIEKYLEECMPNSYCIGYVWGKEVYTRAGKNSVFFPSVHKLLLECKKKTS